MIAAPECDVCTTLGVSAVAGLSMVWYILRHQHRHLCHKKKDTPEQDIAKQGFSITKVPGTLDVIIIGSGIGGLTAGALLSKEGYKSPSFGTARYSWRKYAYGQRGWVRV